MNLLVDLYHVAFYFMLSQCGGNTSNQGAADDEISDGKNRNKRGKRQKYKKKKKNKVKVVSLF